MEEPSSSELDPGIQGHGSRPMKQGHVPAYLQRPLDPRIKSGDDKLGYSAHHTERSGTAAALRPSPPSSGPTDHFQP